MHKSILILVISIWLSSCGSRTNNDLNYNLSVYIDREFPVWKSAYKWAPDAEGSLLGSGNFDITKIDVNGSGDGAVIAAAAIIAIAVTVAGADVTIHNLKSLNLVIELTDESQTKIYPLEYGMNRFEMSPYWQDGIKRGFVKGVLRCHGTRSFVIPLPLSGIDSKQDINYFDFSKDGQVYVNGMKI
jgi:hypothetical protein